MKYDHLRGNKYAVGNKGNTVTLYKPEYAKQLIDFFSIEPKRKELVAKSIAKDKKTGAETFTKDEWKYVPNELPTLTRFAKKIGVSYSALHNWINKGLEDDPKYIDFKYAYLHAKELYKQFLISNGLEGLYNGAFAIFVAKNTTDMKDKVDTEVTINFSLSQLLSQLDERNRARQIGRLEDQSHQVYISDVATDSPAS